MSKQINLISVLTGLYSGKRTGDSANEPKTTPQIDSPVYLKEPVSNPRLVAAIYKHQQTQSEDAAVDVFEEIKSATLLIGVILEKPSIQKAKVEAPFLKGDGISVVATTDNSNKRLLALFTDLAEMQRFTNQANSVYVMPAKVAMNFVLEKGFDGFLINPAGVFLRLDTPFIRDVINEM